MSALTNSSAPAMAGPTAERIGGKAATLLALQRAGFCVPEFVVSPSRIDELVSQLGFPLVVRSSASVEDGAEVSFAGQFRSFLNLATAAQVQQAVRQCHASLHQDSVLEYCRKNGVSPQSMRMQVIIQRMIQPELAGVVFTVNPVTGAEEVVMEAVAGLADGLLAGREQALPDDHPLLMKYRDAIEQTARRIHRHFGAPQDIEFAIQAGTVYILQSRPITRIGFAAETGQWTNADFRDGGVSSSVCTPLMWSLYQSVWDRALKQTLRELHMFSQDFPASRMFFGRPYWNLGAVKESLSALPGYNERAFDQDLSVQINYDGDGCVTPVNLLGVVRAIPTVLAVKRFFKTQHKVAQTLLDGSVDSILQRYNPQCEHVDRTLRALIEHDYHRIECAYFRTIFAASLAKLDFTSSFPDADYSALVSALPPLRHVEPVRVVQAMRDRSPDQLSRVIDNYRHHYRVGLDLVHPRWDEDREFVSQMLAGLPRSAGNDPLPVYQAARDAMLRTLPRRRQASFRRKLGRLRSFLWLREQLRDVSNQVYYRIRRCVLELARRRGLGDDIFFQTYHEIFTDTRTHIEGNREIYESYRNFAAPHEIGSGFRFDRVDNCGHFVGLAASPGTLTAPAFVASEVEQASRMPRGHILVCPYTDPGWTPVLDRVGGVVTETGGLLSHAAIICREFGIPAVLGVENATTRITHGAHLTIHGTEGRVWPAPITEGDQR